MIDGLFDPIVVYRQANAVTGYIIDSKKLSLKSKQIAGLRIDDLSG